MEKISKHIVEMKIDKDRVLEIGDVCRFIANGICYFGTYEGLTARGFLQFSAAVENWNVTYAVSHKSIKAIEVIKHEVK